MGEIVRPHDEKHADAVAAAYPPELRLQERTTYPHRFLGRREWGIKPGLDMQCQYCGVALRNHQNPTLDELAALKPTPNVVVPPTDVPINDEPPAKLTPEAEALVNPPTAHGIFHPPQMTQSQMALIDTLATQLEGVLTSSRMHMDADTTRYVHCRLNEIAGAFWRDLAGQ